MKLLMSHLIAVRDLKIEHKKWTEALELVYILLVSVSPGEVICISGPSRAGKTKLISELINLLVSEIDYSETGEMPVVSVKAVNSARHGSFSTKSFTKKLLHAVQHPFYGEDDFEDINKQDRISEDVYRQALEKALIARKAKYLFIDEAQHAKYVSKDAQGAYAVMDSWKCLAEEAGIVLIVVGAYPILDIIRKSPHMVGRRHQVNLGRYRVERSDLLEFKAILAEYGKTLKCQALLSQNMDMIYKGSLGCIGLVRHWLMRAAGLAITRKTILSEEILLESMPSEDDLNSLSEEIRNGELLLDELENSHGLTEKPKTKRKKAKNKPFQRKAERISADRRLGEAND